MLEFDTVGLESVELDRKKLEIACTAAFEAVGVRDGHFCVSFASRKEIQDLNRRYGDKDVATDVLSFPIDRSEEVAGPRELGDIVICADEAEDLLEAAVHGALHLAGLDHEVDTGQMLSLQKKVLADL